MSALIMLPPDFPYDDICEVGRILEHAQVLVPGYIPPDGGLYNPDCYLFDVRVDQTEFLILPDRNVVSRIARVGMGEDVDPDRRVAAALMAFAQCLNLNFEPSIAFHELGHKQGNHIAHAELRAFRAADEARPQEWLDVALGRAGRFRSASALPAISELDLAKPIRRWRRNYILGLKIGELELEAAPALEKVIRLLDWMYHDFILGGPAALFASLYFAPSSPRRRMLKQLRSPHRERAVEGVRNAAWDITHVSEFVRHVQEEGSDRKRFLLATADKSLARISSSLFHYGDEFDGADMLADRLCSWWNPEEASSIAEALCAYIDRIGEPARHTNFDMQGDYIADLIIAGERRLLRWQPE